MPIIDHNKEAIEQIFEYDEVDYPPEGMDFDGYVIKFSEPSLAEELELAKLRQLGYIITHIGFDEQQIWVKQSTAAFGGQRK